MSVFDEVQVMNERRMNIWMRSKELLDRAVREHRELSAEEDANHRKAIDDITKIDRERDALLASDRAQTEFETTQEAFRRLSPPGEHDRQRESTALREFFGGQRSSVTIDLRAASYVHRNYSDGARGADLFENRGLYSDAGAGSLTVPSLVASNIYSTMLSKNVMRQTRMSLLTTPNGDPLTLPVGSEGVATQVATQNTVIGGSDPSLASVRLNAYKIGEIVYVANDLATDSGVDVLSWVGNTVGAACATKEEAWWVAGTGSTMPTGIVNGGGTGIGGTVATSGSLLLGPAGAVVEKLIDLQFSVNSSYRANGEWLVADSTAAAMRKLRSDGGGTIGPFLWSPSPTAGLIDGQPDVFMGRPIYTSSNMASVGSNTAKVAVYGDFQYFAAREVQGLRLERSTDLKFDLDQIAIRGLLRTDSALTDATAINILRGAPA